MAASFVGAIRVCESRAILWEMTVYTSGLKEKALRFERGRLNCVDVVRSECNVCPERAIHRPCLLPTLSY
jgi:hypothetical protein